MKRSGFKHQKPMKRAYEQNPEAVQGWLENTYPVIKRRAGEEKAEIYWGDETGARNDCHIVEDMHHEARRQLWT
jgi:hypothetical protein